MGRSRIVFANWYDYPQYYDVVFQAYTQHEADFIEAACRKYCPFAARRLLAIVKPGGILYVSWRVTADADQRDGSGRLYTAFEAGLVRGALAPVTLLLDEEVVSASSGKTIHRIVARRDALARR